MPGDRSLKLLSENEFSDRILTIIQGKINDMMKGGDVIGLRLVIKGNMLSDDTNRYTISIDAGTVYKFLVDPKI